MRKDMEEGERRGEGGRRDEEIEERGKMLAGSEKECQKANTDNSQELFINNLPSPSTFRYLDNYVVKCFNTNHRWSNVILSVSISDSCKLIRE